MRWLPASFSVLTYHDFRLVWFGQFVAMVGNQMQTVALGWLVYSMTDSAAQLGLVGLMRAIPMVFMSLYGGTLADQVDRRRLLLVTQTILALLSASLALLVTLDLATVYLLYGFAFVTAGAAAFDSPSRQAIIPALVPRARLANALTMNVLSNTTGMVLGPAVGGLLIGQFGSSAAFWVGAASFMAVVLALVLMRTRPPVPVPARRGFGSLVDGFRFVRQRSIIWQLMVLDFAGTLLVTNVGLLPVFARDVFSVGPEGLGVLYAAPSAGAVIGSLIFASIPTPRKPGRMVAIAISGYGLALGLFGLAPTFTAALIMLGLAGALDAVSMAMRHTVRQLATPDDFRGRIGAFASIFSGTGPRLGEFQAGIMASFLGARSAMVIGGLACVVIAMASRKWADGLWAYEGEESDEELPELSMTETLAGEKLSESVTSEHRPKSVR